MSYANAFISFNTATNALDQLDAAIVLEGEAIKEGLDISNLRQLVIDLKASVLDLHEAQESWIRKQELEYIERHQYPSYMAFKNGSLLTYARVLVADPNNKGVFDNNRYFQAPIKATRERKIAIKRAARRQAKYN